MVLQSADAGILAVVIANNTMDTSGECGFLLSTAPNEVSTGILFAGNHEKDSTAGSLSFGHTNSNTLQKSTLTDNHFESANIPVETAGVIDSSADGGNVVRGNRGGLIFEGSGIGTIKVGTSCASVTHRLSQAPCIVLATGLDSAEVANLIVTHISATTFILEATAGNVTADRTFMWWASCVRCPST